MNAYKELPEGYTLAKEVDAAGNKKLAVLFNLAALLLTAAVFCAGCLIRFRGLPPLALMLENLWALEGMLGLFLLGMLAYLVLHELTHGAVYKLLTGEKLTFGIRPSCAYCGVPNIFVTRKTALLAVLAPFALFTLLFLPLIALRSSYCALLFLLLFALHAGGCVGDLYCAYLLLFRLKGPLLMKDTGPKQSFYLKR